MCHDGAHELLAEGGVRRVELGAAQPEQALLPLAHPPPQACAALLQDPDSPAPDQGLSLDAARELCEDPSPHLRRPSDLFCGFLELDPAASLPDDPGLAPLKAALGAPLVVRTTGNQYLLEPGLMGNRVLFYGDDHKEIAELIHHPAFRGRGRFIKLMTQYPQTHWAGGPERALSKDRASLCTDHGGAFIPVIDANGARAIGWVDFPTDYNRLGADGHGALLAFFSLDDIDFAGPLPPPAQWEAMKASIYATMDTMACLQAIAVPFAREDPRPYNRDFHFNILEVTDLERMRAYTELLSRPGDPDHLRRLGFWSLYCTEAVWNNCNYANFPINPWAVDHGYLSQAALDSYRAMARVFEAAGGLEPGLAALGWEALATAGHITRDQLATLRRNNLENVPFVLSAEDVRPYTDYGPTGGLAPGELGEGLVGRPLTIAGLLGGVIEVSVPRQKISALVATRLQEAVSAASAAEADAIVLGALRLLRDRIAALAQQGIAVDLALDPATAPGRARILRAFGDMVAAQQQLDLLGSRRTRRRLQRALQYEHMDSASQRLIDRTLRRHQAIVADFSASPRTLARRLRAFDRRVSRLRVSHRDPFSGELITGPLMRFVPPQIGPLIFNGATAATWPGLRPVANLMHRRFQKGSAYDPARAAAAEAEGRHVAPLGEGAGLADELDRLAPDLVFGLWFLPHFGAADELDQATAVWAANLLEGYVCARTRDPAADDSFSFLDIIARSLRRRGARGSAGATCTPGGTWPGAYRAPAALAAELQALAPHEVLSWAGRNFSDDLTTLPLQQLRAQRELLRAYADAHRGDAEAGAAIAAIERALQRLEQERAAREERALRPLGLDEAGYTATLQEILTLPRSELGPWIEARYGAIARLAPATARALRALVQEAYAASCSGGQGALITEREWRSAHPVLRRLSARAHDATPG